MSCWKAAPGPGKPAVSRHDRRFQGLGTVTGNPELARSGALLGRNMVNKPWALGGQGRKERLETGLASSRHNPKGVLQES